jgi:aspartate kinase
MSAEMIFTVENVRVKTVQDRDLSHERKASQIMSQMSSPSSSSLSSESESPPPVTPPNLHQNTLDPSAKWLVQKYGGTSVGKFAVRIAKDVVS